MAERTTISQRVQIGVEVTPGTAVAATRRLQSAEISISPDGGVQVIRGAGAKWPALAALGKEFAGGSLDGAPTYTELVYFLAGILGDPTITPVVGATAAYDWEWDIETYDVQDAKTLTIERGSNLQAERTTGAVLTGLGIEYNRDELSLSGDMLARAFETGFTLTAAGVTDLPLVPVLPREIDVYLDDTAAGLGTTKLLRVLSASWEMGDRFGALWPLNSALPSYAATYEIEPSADVSLTMAADAVGMGLFDTMRAGSTKFLRIGSASDTEIEAGFPYEMDVDLAVKVDDLPDYSDEDGIYAVGWNFGLFHDSDFGKAGHIRVRNGLAAL